MSLIILSPDDQPTCPKHGVRVPTDFFVGEKGEEFERGKCPLCNRMYTFVIEETEEPSLTDKAREMANQIFGFKGAKA